MTALQTWFKLEKGIEPNTLNAWDVECEGDTIRFNYPHGAVKFRTGMIDGKRQFRQEGSVGLYYRPCESAEHFTKAIICEGETDTMQLWQQFGQEARIYGLPGNNAWKPGMAALFNDYAEVYVVLDNDSNEYAANQTEAVYKQIKTDIGRGKVHRIHLPSDVKDLVEFFVDKGHTVDEFASLLMQAKEGTLHFTPVDFTVDLGPTDWLIEDMIARGDVVMLLGEPNAGKSMIAQSIVAAIARGDELLWKQKHVWCRNNRIMVVDEENPLDVIHSRMRDFGIAGYEQNIRYLSDQGIRLDKPASFDRLYDEVEAFKPEVIVLDSLVRLHTMDENSSADMGRLYNNSIKPLSRELGCTVIVLHHAGKTDSNSSYKRGRGSGELAAFPDTGYDVRPIGVGKIHLACYKNRRGAKTNGTSLAMMNENGRLVLGPDEDTGPF